MTTATRGTRDISGLLGSAAGALDGAGGDLAGPGTWARWRVEHPGGPGMVDVVAEAGGGPVPAAPVGPAAVAGVGPGDAGAAQPGEHVPVVGAERDGDAGDR